MTDFDDVMRQLHAVADPTFGQMHALGAAARAWGDLATNAALAMVELGKSGVPVDVILNGFTSPEGIRPRPEPEGWPFVEVAPEGPGAYYVRTGRLGCVVREGEHLTITFPAPLGAVQMAAIREHLEATWPELAPRVVFVNGTPSGPATVAAGPAAGTVTGLAPVARVQIQQMVEVATGHVVDRLAGIERMLQAPTQSPDYVHPDALGFLAERFDVLAGQMRQRSAELGQHIDRRADELVALFVDSRDAIESDTETIALRRDVKVLREAVRECKAREERAYAQGRRDEWDAARETTLPVVESTLDTVEPTEYEVWRDALMVAAGVQPLAARTPAEGAELIMVMAEILRPSLANHGRIEDDDAPADGASVLDMVKTSDGRTITGAQARAEGVHMLDEPPRRQPEPVDTERHTDTVIR